LFALIDCKWRDLFMQSGVVALKRAGSVITLTLALASCAPQLLTFFKPSAPTGEVFNRRGECADRYISFAPAQEKRAMVTLDMEEAYHGESGTLHLSIYKRSPDGLDRFARSKEEIERWTEWAETPLVVKAATNSIVIIWADGGRLETAFSLPAPLGRSPATAANGRRAIELPGFSGNWAEVHLPSLELDGNPLQIPTVRFELTTRLEFCAVDG
jgi:hypothetical protein